MTKSDVGSGFSRTCLLAAFVLAFTHSGLAQLAAPNAAGVAMGYLRFWVKDIDATRKFWLALGGRAPKLDVLNDIGGGDLRAQTASTNSIVFPDVIVMLSQGTPKGSGGSVVNHVAFRVRTFAEVEARGFTVQRLQQFPGVGSITTPDGERIELFENAATNLTFTPDVGPVDPVAARHNRPMTGPIAFHHIHLNVPAEDVAAAKAWYARVFGGTPGKRSSYDAVDLPGVNINISAAPKALPGTAGQALDRIGFEVQDLKAFEERLKAMNLLGDVVFTLDRVGYGTRTLADPWGTAIQVTQGLAKW
jgi:catechol 2,3-dioxygenase-like lactoylglutathione lyase family enzyme